MGAALDFTIGKSLQEYVSLYKMLQFDLNKDYCQSLLLSFFLEVAKGVLG